ncbi:TolC family protein [Maribacter polysiphoniae]|uniref:Outer membrane protein n=1 Tax=Maribacter polysiphoniae TaxID=429344 RepID=A0A316E4M4_9FLAO|nr:TolC family protein [Maribacter polysiphoniae]MBD1259034.1 TolC family protein [Maribacter polysiphoniae]PWK24588.1 outer membrane protein [Maribacter polysiphoniae]
MRKYIIVYLTFLVQFAQGQVTPELTPKIWTLDDCISYALENNITVKQAELQKNSSVQSYMAAKSSRLPNLTGTASQNFTNGNSIDPITSDFVSQQINSTSLGLTTQVTLFQGNQINNQIKQNKLLVDQYSFYEEEAQNNIILSLTESYIQLLYSKENIIISENNLEASQKEEERAKARLDAGSIALKDYTDAQSQTATNAYNLITAKNDYAQQLLTLKQLLELPNGESFQIADTNASDLGFIPNIDDVYAQALEKLPEINASKINVSVSEKELDIAKGGYLPTLSLLGSIGSGYTSTQDFVFADQLDLNFNQRVGLSLNVPIFNRNQTKTEVEKAKINIDIAELELVQQEKDLYRKIETAWLNASAAQAQMLAADTARKAAQESYRLAQKQYELGALSTTDLVVSQNTYTNAEQNYNQAKYLSLLYTQLLQFYQGNDIKL